MPESRLEDEGEEVGKRREDYGVNYCGEEEKRPTDDAKLSRCSGRVRRDKKETQTETEV